jgi:hypothetical protein
LNWKAVAQSQIDRQDEFMFDVEARIGGVSRKSALDVCPRQHPQRCRIARPAVPQPASKRPARDRIADAPGSLEQAAHSPGADTSGWKSLASANASAEGFHVTMRNEVNGVQAKSAEAGMVVPLL